MSHPGLPYIEGQPKQCPKKNKQWYTNTIKGSLWPWSYDRWFFNYLSNQCLSPLRLWVRILLKARCTRYNSMWSSLPVVTCDRSVVFFGGGGSPVSCSWTTERMHDVTEILLKVALNSMSPPQLHRKWKIEKHEHRLKTRVWNHH